MSQGARTVLSGTIEWNQYLPLAASPPSLILISWQVSAGSSGMEPRGTGRKKKEIISIALQVSKTSCSSWGRGQSIWGRLDLGQEWRWCDSIPLFRAEFLCYENVFEGKKTVKKKVKTSFVISLKVKSLRVRNIILWSGLLGSVAQLTNVLRKDVVETLTSDVSIASPQAHIWKTSPRDPLEDVAL